jgi:hypothetical protein
MMVANRGVGQVGVLVRDDVADYDELSGVDGLKLASLFSVVRIGSSC